MNGVTDEKLDRLEYVSDMLGQLRQIAGPVSSQFLVFLIEMALTQAVREAEHRRRDER